MFFHCRHYQRCVTTSSSPKILISGMKTISCSVGVIASSPTGAIPGHPVRAFIPHWVRGKGNAKKFCSDLAFLLVLPEKTTEEEMIFRLAMVWVYPYQACIPTLDEAARKLTLPTTSHENWAYTFVKFNKDAQHVSLPKEGHLNAMTEGMPSRNMCQHLYQLEVHLLLQSECQEVYQGGLNGALELVVTSLPESFAHETNILDEPTFLLVDLSEASALHDTFAPTSHILLTEEHPPRVEGHISMTTEVQELLSHTALDTSSQALGTSTPKRLASMALGAPLSSKAEDSSKHPHEQPCPKSPN